jgi:hypothetical protein
MPRNPQAKGRPSMWPTEKASPAESCEVPLPPPNIRQCSRAITGRIFSWSDFPTGSRVPETTRTSTARRLVAAMDRRNKVSTDSHLRECVIGSQADCVFGAFDRHVETNNGVMGWHVKRPICTGNKGDKSSRRRKNQSQQVQNGRKMGEWTDSILNGTLRIA